MNSKTFVSAFCMVMLGVFLVTPALAQSTFGTILGTVTDTSGAVVPNVSVTVTNQGENTAREVHSDAQGNYQAENLKAGIYTVSANVTGFREITLKDVRLEARQIVRTDLKLTVGSTAEKVTVEARAELINTESPTISASFDSNEVLSLPANYRGAGSTSPYQLLAYLPGVQADSGGEISVQGAAPFQVEYTVDGISTASVRYSGPQREMFPSAENISEMKVQGSSNSAEYGQAGDITTTTKSGTNSFHGSVFEYLQNAAFDATQYGSPDKPAKSANTFGFSFSGPLYKNHTFFFFDYEGMRYRTQETLHETVPTQAMRDGNFSGVFYPQFDPNQPPNPVRIFDFDNTHFDNETIPTNRINPVAPAILQYYPLPNHFDPAVGPLDYFQVFNHVVNVANPILSDQFDLRVDHTINAKQSVFGRWTHKKTDIISPSGLLLPAETDFDKETQIVLAHNYAITPNLVNELRGGISRGSSGGNFPVDGPAFMQQLALNGLGPFPQGGFPHMVPYGNSSISGISHSRPNPQLSSNFQINENLTWTKGKHTMKFGFDWRRLRLTNAWYSTTGDDYGDFWFNGQYTSDYSGSTPESGYDFADFLLGVPYYSDVTHTAPNIDGRTKHYYAYAEDTFKVSSKLTIDFGLRFSRLPPFDDPINHTNFDPSVPLTGRVVISSDPRSLALTNPLFLQNINACPNPDYVFGDGTTVPCTPFLTAKEAGWPEGLRKTYSNWAPRFGFAYRPFGGNSTVIRGGIGMYTVTTLGTVFYSIAGIHDGYQASFINSWDENSQPLFQFPNVQTGDPLGISIGTQRFETANQFAKKDPYTYQWNLTVERTLHGNTALRVSYIGSRGVQLTWAPDLNQPLPSTTSFGSRPAGDFPFPVWSHIYTRSAGATSSYNSMQTELIHKYSSGLTFQSTWTWAKNLSDTGSFPGSYFGGEAGDGRSLDAYNVRGDWGNAAGTRRHRWMTTMLYELPIGKGRHLLANANSVVNGVVGGWRLSTIALVQSGPFLTAWIPGDASGTGAQASRTGGQRPDAVGDGNMSNPKPSQWWNPSVFACPGGEPGIALDGCYGADPIGRFGTSRAGNLIGPGTINVSLGLAKDFRLTERFMLKFESSFTNLPNHINFADPDTNLGGGTFGKVTSARGSDSGGNRVGQFAVRVEF